MGGKAIEVPEKEAYHHVPAGDILILTIEREKFT